MPYADTDFFLALLKPQDWLKKPAKHMLSEYKNQLWTSPWTIAEVMFVAKGSGLDIEALVGSVFDLAKVRGLDRNTALSAAHMVVADGLGVLDSLHAAACGQDVIISSDSAFDKVGLKRVPLK